MECEQRHDMHNAGVRVSQAGSEEESKDLEEEVTLSSWDGVIERPVDGMGWERQP